MSNYKTFIAVADSHGSLICPEAAKVVLAFAKTIKASYRIHLGDVWDFAPLRHGASQEERACGISEDYEMGWDFLSALRPTHLCLGNHDDRIWMNVEKQPDGILRERCEGLAMDAEERLRKMKTAFVQYSVDHYLKMPEGGPKLIHGFHSNMHPAKANQDFFGDSLSGHIHRPDSYTARHCDGGKSFTLGCIGDIKKMTYAKRHPARMGWRNGFLYGYINTRTGAWHAWQVVKEKNANEWISPQGIL
jgi:predicted phosphodiesterase